jgi:hypothetical protein
MNGESTKNAVSIPRAAKKLGLDSFTIYGLIQNEKFHPRRERWGELVILEIELEEAVKEPIKKK